MTLNLPRNSTMYALGRTNTLRAASGAILDTWGTNLQNIEKSLRRMYIADDGKKLAQCDQSGAEALIVAYLAEDGVFRELFKNDIKPHTYGALHLFKDEWKTDKTLDVDGLCKLPPATLKLHPQWKGLNRLIKSSDDWPPKRRFYYMAKQTVHSGSYGIHAPTFRFNILEKSDGRIVLTKEQSEYFLSYWRQLIPEIPRWNIKTQLQVEKTRELRNLFGHPRYFGGVVSESFYQESYAFVPQSTVGEITHRAFRDLQCFIEDNKLDWDLLANTHDSYLVQYPDSETEEKEVVKWMKHFMEQELTSPSGIKFRMKSDVGCGYNWAPYKKDYNERGLKEV